LISLESSLIKKSATIAKGKFAVRFHTCSWGDLVYEGRRASLALRPAKKKERTTNAPFIFVDLKAKTGKENEVRRKGKRPRAFWFAQGKKQRTCRKNFAKAAGGGKKKRGEKKPSLLGAERESFWREKGGRGKVWLVFVSISLTPKREKLRPKTKKNGGKALAATPKDKDLEEIGRLSSHQQKGKGASRLLCCGLWGVQQAQKLAVGCKENLATRLRGEGGGTSQSNIRPSWSEGFWLSSSREKICVNGRFVN